MIQKAIQIFTPEYLERSKQLTADQVVEFLEQYRQVAAASVPVKSKLISIKIPENLLGAFKTKAYLNGRPYQRVIKDLMREWVSKG